MRPHGWLKILANRADYTNGCVSGAGVLESFIRTSELVSLSKHCDLTRRVLRVGRLVRIEGEP